MPRTALFVAVFTAVLLFTQIAFAETKTKLAELKQQAEKIDGEQGKKLLAAVEELEKKLLQTEETDEIIDDTTLSASLAFEHGEHRNTTGSNYLTSPKRLTPFPYFSFNFITAVRYSETDEQRQAILALWKQAKKEGEEIAKAIIAEEYFELIPVPYKTVKREYDNIAGTRWAMMGSLFIAEARNVKGQGDTPAIRKYYEFWHIVPTKLGDILRGSNLSGEYKTEISKNYQNWQISVPITAPSDAEKKQFESMANRLGIFGNAEVNRNTPSIPPAAQVQLAAVIEQSKAEIVKRKLEAAAADNAQTREFLELLIKQLEQGLAQTETMYKQFETQEQSVPQANGGNDWQNIDSNARAVFNKAVRDFVGAILTPLQYRIKTVNGTTQYQFKCSGKGAGLPPGVPVPTFTELLTCDAEGKIIDREQTDSP